MGRTHFVAAGLLALPAVASAQSATTLYGIADAAFVHVTNRDGQEENYLRSGNLAASRLGFRGVEQLTGTARATFLLENGYDIDTGAQSSPSSLFNRQAYVGLGDTRLGDLTFGRQYTPYYAALGPLGPSTTATGATGAHPGDIDGLDTTIRLNNSIGYISPDWQGLKVSGMIALGESTNRSSVGSSASLAVQYARGAWRAAIGYLRMTNADASTGLWSPNSTSSFTISAVNRGFLSADTIHISGVAVQHDFDDLTVGINATNVRYRPGVNSRFVNTAVFNTIGGLASYQIGNGFAVSGAYSYTQLASGNRITDAARYHQLSLEQTYSFSKRTALYLLEAWQVASGSTLGPLGISQQVEAMAVVGDSQASSPASHGRQGVLMAGVRHSF